MQKDEVIGKIDDWERRLERLYEQLAAWYESLPTVPGQQFLKGQVLQHDEPLMRKFDVSPRMLPTRSILHGRNRVSFVPSALWIVGANGRVNITTNEGQHILVDTEGRDPTPSRWMIVAPDRRGKPVEFGAEVFASLVLHQAITQAA